MKSPRIQVEIWKPAKKDWDNAVAVVDTGAFGSVIRLQQAKDYGYKLGDVHHCWQMSTPVNGNDMELKIRYKNKEVLHEAVAIPVDSTYCEDIKPSEICTRPPYPHFLGDHIILGMSFLKKLDEDDLREIMENV